jgi:ABC-type multidrug transport system ATPase subunit
MRTIATLQEPDEGQITLGELDVLIQKHEVRKVLGYLPQDFGFYPKVTAWDMLQHFARLKGLSQNSQRNEIVSMLLNQTNLWDARNRNLSEYSGGMRQRFGIAQALLGNPKLVIVDEPTAGLDPQERNRFHNLLSEIGQSVIVILSTHIVDDVKNLCSRMVVMNKGTILRDSTPEEAIRDLEGKIYRKVVTRDEVNELRKELKVISTRMQEGNIVAHIFSVDSLPQSFDKVQPDLEDVYFATIS